MKFFKIPIVKGGILLISFFICFPGKAQKVINAENSQSGHITLAHGIAIPKINNGYTLWIPETGDIHGMVVFTHARRDTVDSEFIIDYALENQLAVLYATTSNRLEFFFDEESMAEILGYIHDVVTKYNIQKNNLLYCGMSLEGTRALKLAIFGQSDHAPYRIKPRAVAICDSPLDMVRFHKEMIKAIDLNFNPITVNEGTWVSGYLESNLGGTPEDVLSAYIKYSPYCYTADGGPNISMFSDIAVRAYTEPDVEWWIETRRKDYYAMNAIDLAAFINTLSISGNPNAELIITEDKGYHPNGERHPHSWSIVDEKELIDWFVGLLNKDY